MSNFYQTNTEIKEYLLSLVGNSPFGIIALDTLGKIAIVNQTLLDYFFLKEDINSYIDKNVLKVILGIPEFENRIKQCLLEGRRPFDIEEIKLKNRIISIRGRVILNGLLITVEDISAIKRAEEDLLKRAEQLEAMNRELGQFAFIASHDLQEPLRTITNYAELLTDEYLDKLDDTGQKSLTFMLQASNRMSELIKGLMDYSRIGRGKELEILNCDFILKDVSDSLQKKILETKTVLKISKMPKIKGYRVELRSLFQNLILNAIKFQNAGTIPRIVIKAEEDDKNWVFSVEDNGIGIDQKQFKNIFIIYQRLHLREDYEGTGIGLAHCKKIAELHGGKIWVDSTKGEGSKFCFSIPT